MKIRIGKQSMLLLFGIAAFIFNSVLRSSIKAGVGFTSSSMITTINFLAIIALIFIFIRLCWGLKIHKSDFRFGYLLLIVIYAIFVTYSNSSGVSESRYMGPWVLFASIIPGMLLCAINFKDSIDFELLLRRITIVLNVVFLIAFIIGIADYFMGGVVNNFIADNLSTESWAEMIRTENSTYGFRMCTIFGSPLMNAFYALVVIGFNSIYKRIYNKTILNIWVIYGICIITIFLTGSRAALILGVALVLFSELTARWGFVRVLILFIIFALLIQTPLFQETVGARLEIGFMSDSDARYNLVVSFLNNDFGEIKLFSGGGYNYSRELTATASSATMNFEYPFLMFLFDYGIVATVLYYLLYFAYPLIILIKNKQYYCLLVFCILFVFLQTSNAVAQYYDFNLQLGFIITMFIGISEYKNTEVVEEKYLAVDNG